MVGKALCRAFAQGCRKERVASGVARHGIRRLCSDAVKGLRELLCSEERAPRGAGRYSCVGAFSVGTEPVFQSKSAARGEQPPLEQVPPGNLTRGQGLHDLQSVLTRAICLAKAGGVGISTKINHFQKTPVSTVESS